MASLPPGSCCMEGYAHHGEPVGTITKYTDFDIYVAKPPVATDKVIVYLTDIFGMPFTNHKLIADNFAQQGFLTVIPNLFYDDHVPFPRPDGFDLFPGWVSRHQPEHTEPIIDKTFEYVKKEFPAVTKFFSVGYCFGAKYVVRLLDEGKLTAGYIAHPSFVTEDELRAIKAPLSIAAAETDPIFPDEKRHQSEVILKEIKATYNIVLYSSVEHGFAVRGDMSNEVVTWSQEAAFFQAVQWFNRFSK
ncbi:dienelactone hydrolase [Lipomyces orientalis]|uniref:Dienelactone hydrolase n=1 Tax=Lipomyces orientalis TaxID=1233043 RepID=A0ACC3TKX3_9ASCO